MNVQIEKSWQERLQEEFDKPYFEKLVTFIKTEYGRAHVLPPVSRIFHIFNACPFEKEKINLIDTSKHLVLTTVHPSPRSADYGFFGCRHFSKANAFLQSKGIEEIDW